MQGWAMDASGDGEKRGKVERRGGVRVDDGSQKVKS